MWGTTLLLALEFTVGSAATVIAGWVLFSPLRKLLGAATTVSVGWAVGRRPVAVRLFGADAWHRFVVAGVTVHVGWSLFASPAVLARPSPADRRREGGRLTSAAAPAAEFVFLVSAWWVMSRTTGWVADLAFGAAFGAGLAVVSAVAPRDEPVGCGSSPLRSSDDALVELTARAWDDDTSGRLEVARNIAETGDDVVGVLAACEVLFEAGEHDVVRRAMVRTLAHPAFEEQCVEHRVLVWNRLCWADLYLGDPMSLRRAEHHARLAVGAMPSPMTEDALAWTRLCRGHFAESHAVFTRIYEVDAGAARRAITARGLAYAAEGLGDAELADAWHHVATARGGDFASPRPSVDRSRKTDPSRVRTRLDESAIAERCSSASSRPSIRS